MVNFTTQDLLNKKLLELEEITGWDILFYDAPISQWIIRNLKYTIEDIKKEKERNKISIILTTTGWQAEWAEDFVNILRNNYKIVDFIIPDYAMSAWTILAMSWDDIWMDYSSSLWPIDPQIQWNDWNFIPASWYLDGINELIYKEKNWIELTKSELNIVVGADIWKLKFIEQAKNLTITLLKDWLVKYKFKDWSTHEWKFNPNKKWQPVTEQEKEERAEEIASMLWNINLWHSHWRSINMEKLKNKLKLKIKNINEDNKLSLTLKEYYDIINMYKWNINFIHTRNFI